MKTRLVLMIVLLVGYISGCGDPQQPPPPEPNDIVYDAFKGKIDEVRIYNRALTPAEIMEQYEAGLKKIQTEEPKLEVATAEVKPKTRRRGRRRKTPQDR